MNMVESEPRRSRSESPLLPVPDAPHTETKPGSIHFRVEEYDNNMLQPQFHHLDFIRKPAHQILF